MTDDFIGHVNLTELMKDITKLKAKVAKLEKRGMYHGRQFNESYPKLSMSEQHAKDMK